MILHKKCKLEITHVYVSDWTTQEYG